MGKSWNQTPTNEMVTIFTLNHIFHFKLIFRAVYLIIELYFIAVTDFFVPVEIMTLF
jgi:hypothetical protein